MIHVLAEAVRITNSAADDNFCKLVLDFLKFEPIISYVKT